MRVATRARAATDNGPIPGQRSGGVGQQHGHGEGCAAVADGCHATPAPLFALVGGAGVLDDPVDRRTFERLYRSPRPRLHRFVRMVEPSDAEDIAAEVWLAVTAYLCRFRAEGEGFEALVFTIARRRITDHRRRRAYRRTDTVANDSLTDGTGNAETDREAMDQLRTRATLEELFGTLPRAQVEVVVLRVLYGLPVERVATRALRRESFTRCSASNRRPIRHCRVFITSTPSDGRGTARRPLPWHDRWTGDRWFCQRCVAVRCPRLGLDAYERA
jgi:RNA polymerase sigma factor (sigma-70 family)